MSPGPAPATSEVKGLWFVCARRYAVQEFGDRGLREVLAELPPDVRPSLSEPLPSHWYPESHLQACLDATRRVLAGDDPDEMQRVLEGCTMIGINAFWRVALRVTAPQFALRALPVSWRHMRRGAGYMRVDIEGRVGRIHYGDFPYFDDPNYRLLVLGTLEPLLQVSTGRKTPVAIVQHTKSSLTAQVRL